MTSTERKIRKAVDGDMGVEMLIERYHRLSGYIQVAQDERDEVAEKLRLRADELEADVLTVGGRNVVHVIRYDLFSVKAKEIAQRYPRIFKRFGHVTPVTRVDVR